MSQTKRTLLVVVEGLMADGKSTVVSKLARQLHAVELRTPSHELADEEDACVCLSFSACDHDVLCRFRSCCCPQGHALAGTGTQRGDGSLLLEYPGLRGSRARQRVSDAELDAFAKWLIPGGLDGISPCQSRVPSTADAGARDLGNGGSAFV